MEIDFVDLDFRDIDFSRVGCFHSFVLADWCIVLF